MTERNDGTSQALMSREASALLLEKVVVGGDLSKLSAEESLVSFVTAVEVPL